MYSPLAFVLGYRLSHLITEGYSAPRAPTKHEFTFSRHPRPLHILRNNLLYVRLPFWHNSLPYILRRELPQSIRQRHIRDVVRFSP